MANLSEEEVVVHDDCIIEQYFDDVQDLRLTTSYDEDDHQWDEDASDRAHGPLLSHVDEGDDDSDCQQEVDNVWDENEREVSLHTWDQEGDNVEVHTGRRERQQILHQFSNYYSTSTSRRRRRRRRRSRRVAATRVSIPRSCGDTQPPRHQTSQLPGSRTKWGRFRPQAKVVDSVLELIGNTPLVRLRRVISDERTVAYDQFGDNDEPIEVQHGCEVLLKLDYDNPSSSIKDRVAVAMIEEAEKTSGITPQTTVLVEAVAASSANMGVALAMVAAAKGYHLILATPQSMAMERRVLLRAYGAELVLTSASRGLGGAIAKAEEMVEEMNDPSKTNLRNMRGYLFRHFSNEHNARIHRETTGPEIWEATEGDVDVIVGGVGTGGTLMGIAQYLKALKPEIQTVAVEPTESPVLTREVFKSALASNKPTYSSEHGRDDDENEVDLWPTNDRPSGGQWQNYERLHALPQDSTSPLSSNRRQFLALSKGSSDNRHRSQSALVQPREGTPRRKVSRRPSLIEQASNGSNSDAGGDGIVGPHKIQGIGLGFLPETMDVKMVDEIITVSSDEAMEMARRVCRLEGICCGMSSGATIAAAVRKAQKPSSRNKTIVVVVASQGERYLSTSLYKNLWDEVTRLKAEPLVRDNCSQVVPILHNNNGKDSGRSITTATTATTTTTIPPPSWEDNFFHYNDPFAIDGGGDYDGGRGFYREDVGRKRPNGVKFQRRRSSTASLGGGSYQAD